VAEERPEEIDEDQDDESDEKKGRRKIEIAFIENKSRRHITFSKRKAGIMKKAYELATLTGTQVLLLVASETGHVYTFATPKLQPLITNPEGKNLIQACLNAPEAIPSTGEHKTAASYMSSELKQSPSAHHTRSSSAAASPQPPSQAAHHAAQHPYYPQALQPQPSTPSALGFASAYSHLPTSAESRLPRTAKPEQLPSVPSPSAYATPVPGYLPSYGNPYAPQHPLGAAYPPSPYHAPTAAAFSPTAGFAQPRRHDDGSGEPQH